MRKRWTTRWGLMLGLALLWSPYPASSDDETTFYTTLTKTDTATSAQTDTTLWTPASGKSVVLQGCLISTTRAVQVELEVSNVDVVPPIYVESYGIVLVGGGAAPVATLSADAVLTYSTDFTSHSPSYGKTSVMCWGYEAQL